MSADKKQRKKQNIEQYGVWVKAGPWEIDEGAGFELTNIDDSNDGELPITEEEERILGKLETSPYASSSISTAVPETHEPKGGDIEVESPDKLHSIEEKLDALKNEISHLKDEISELRLPLTTRSGSSKESGGFFDNEEDETIALTDDELVNILDSADMTGEVVDKEAQIVENGKADTALPESDSTTELDKHGDVAIEAPEVEQKAVERPDSDDESIVSLDDIEDLPDEDEDLSEEDEGSEEFEEITDIETLETDTTEDATIEDSIGLQIEEVETEPDSSDVIVTDEVENDVFDEGEEVEIWLDEEKRDLADERDTHEFDMEVISPNEFGLETQMDGSTESASDLTDTTQDIEELSDTENLEKASTKMDIAPAIEVKATEQTVDSDTPGESEISEKLMGLSDVDVDDMMSDESGIESADKIELGIYEDEEKEHDDVEIESMPESPEETGELDVVEIEEETPDDVETPMPESPEETGELDVAEIEEETSVDVEIGSMPESPEETGELDVAEIEEETPVDVEIESMPESPEETGELDVVEIEEETPVDVETPMPESPEEADELDVAEIEEETPVDVETPMPESPEETGVLDVAEIEEETPVDAGIDSGSVGSYEDAYNELPGTEEVDLDSLEALASDTKTEEPEELETVPSIEGTGEKAELPGISSELKDEIKEVLKYMDQLLDSLPDEKVAEFERSEHFDAYKKIFEELGISD